MELANDTDSFEKLEPEIEKLGVDFKAHRKYLTDKIQDLLKNFIEESLSKAGGLDWSSKNHECFK